MKSHLFATVICITSLSVTAHATSQTDDVEAVATQTQTQKSIDLFKQRIAKRPNDVGSLLILGNLYLRHAKEAGEFDAYIDAEETFKEATTLQPDNDAAIVSLATALSKQHRFTEALEEIQPLLEANPTHTAALLAQGDAQLELGNYEAAEKSYTALPMHIAENPSVLVRIARLRELQGNHETAIALAQEALNTTKTLGAEDSQTAWYAWRLGTLHFGNGDLKAAENAYNEALQLHPEDATAIVGIANIRAAQDNLEEATALYEKAIAIDGHPPFMTTLSDLYNASGNQEHAAELVAQAEAIIVEERKNQRSATAHSREASEFYANYVLDPTKAIELAKVDVSLRPDPFAHDTLAWALYRDQQFEAAHETIQLALQGCPSDPTIQFHAGMIELALGNNEAAKEHLRSALDINRHFSFRFANEARAVLEEM